MVPVGRSACHDCGQYTGVQGKDCSSKTKISPPLSEGILLFDVIAHYALFLAIPVAVFFSVALVVCFLAHGQSDPRLDHVALPVQLGTHAGQAFLRRCFE
jgi:hypothetical protein